MKEKENVIAEIEAKLDRFDKKIEELNQKSRREPDKFTLQHQAALENVKSNRALAAERLKDLKVADEGSWGNLRSELEGYINDIDDDFRNSLVDVTFT